MKQLCLVLAAWGLGVVLEKDSARGLAYMLCSGLEDGGNSVVMSGRDG